MTKKPYLTTSPWLPFTSRERKRPELLSHCPSARCQRAKACVDAHENLYCQRSHETPKQARVRLGLAADPIAYTPSKLTAKALKAKRIKNEMLLEDARSEAEARLARWKAGEYDHLYGKYRAQGVWKEPPPRLAP
jgi:hypothetical protein